MRSPPSVATGLFAGRYAIEREIGQGASAIVYLARDAQSGDQVALKILRPELAESRASDRFLREIKRTSALQHRSILPVLDAGEHESQLYFALPFMEGGTLRQLLRREKRLELPRVMQIARDIAEALDYAHERGLIHRDVKPENILFSGGRAVLGDFGIARAIDLSGTGGTGTTSRSVVRGTPAYMSPEQAAGSQDLDGRSDVFSLACVIYEMITGMQAYIGPTDEAVIAMRFVHPPREMQVYRPALNPALDALLKTAFAIVPADRPRTAGELAAALDAASEQSTGPGTHRIARRHLWTAAMSAVLLLVGLKWVSVAGAPTSDFDSAALDSTRLVILADEPTDTGAAAEVADLLREAARLHGYNAVDPFSVVDAITRVGDSPEESRIRRAATVVSAAHYIRFDLQRFSDSMRVHAVLHRTADDALVGSAAARIALDLAGSNSVLLNVARTLLKGIAPVIDVDGAHTTTSLAARQSYLRGHSAIAQWQLAAADSIFSEALSQDPDYAHAALWLAQVRHWQRQSPARWAYAAERALAESQLLSRRDSILAASLVAMSSGERLRACDGWKRLTALDPYDFAAWYGLGSCLAYDSVVVRDSRSPSGWSFRSSYGRALDAYERAWRLLPLIHTTASTGSFAEVRTLLRTSPEALRTGRALAPDTTRFLAYPAWIGDSLAFVPFPAGEFHAARARTMSPAVAEAVLHQRRRFHQIAMMWRAAYPKSVDALEAVALALELIGDRTALDTLRMARSVAGDADDLIRLGTREIWIRMKTAIPDDLRSLSAARLLADSILDRHSPGSTHDAEMLGSLAAITGRANLAARYARMAAARNSEPAIAREGAALLAFAALGGPIDSVHALEREVGMAISETLVQRERPAARAQWLIRAASLAIPEHMFESVAELEHTGSYRLGLLQAISAKDLGAASAILAELRSERERASLQAADIAIDGLYAEAATLVMLGDHEAAAAWLEPTLDSLAYVPSYALTGITRAGALLRSMQLRAQLAHSAGDARTARRWAAATVALTTSADRFLSEEAEDLRRMLSSPPAEKRQP